MSMQRYETRTTQALSDVSTWCWGWGVRSDQAMDDDDDDERRTDACPLAGRRMNTHTNTHMHTSNTPTGTHPQAHTHRHTHTHIRSLADRIITHGQRVLDRALREVAHSHGALHVVGQPGLRVHTCTGVVQVCMY